MKLFRALEAAETARRQVEETQAELKKTRKQLMGDAYARADHVHPTDTSRLAADQGAQNAGKFLVVGNDGLVSPVSVASATGVNF